MTIGTIYQRISESAEFPWRALLLGVLVVGGLSDCLPSNTPHWYRAQDPQVG